MPVPLILSYSEHCNNLKSKYPTQLETEEDLSSGGKRTVEIGLSN